MANGDVPAGWYPDASGGGGERWWDGAQWTEHVRTADPVGSASSGAQQAEVPAGWYPDPSGGAGQRWWDGGQWTEHVHPPVEPEPEPEPVPEPAAAEPEVPAGWYPDPSGGAGQRWWDGGQWTEHVHPPVEPEPEPVPEPGAVEPEVPAGWYPDPSGGAGQRWWDGGQWTEHVHPAPDHLAAGAAAATLEAAHGGAAKSEDDDAAGDPSESQGPPEDAEEPGLGDEHVEENGSPEFEVDETATAAPAPAADIEDRDGDEPDSQALAEAESPFDGGGDPASVEIAPSETVVGETVVGEAEVGQTDAGEAGIPTIPAGWYADPSGTGERWWTGEAWSEHTRTTDAAPDTQATESYAPVAATPEPAATQAMPATAGSGATGMEQTSAAPASTDDGGSGKLVLIIVLLVVLLAAIGAALWFLTDVFGGDEAAAAADDTLEAAPEPEPTPEEEPAPEPEDPTFEDIRDADLAAVAWATTCVGTEADGATRPSQPQPVTFEESSATALLHPNPHDGSGLPMYEVELASARFGDVTGDGADDVVMAVSCEEQQVAARGLAVWSLDGDGRPVQQPSPPVELRSDVATLESFDVRGGGVTVTSRELTPDGSGLTVVTEYRFAGGGWSVDELEREEPAPPLADDQIPGVTHAPFGDDWSYEARPTPQAPLIATHDELPATFVIALDESMLGRTGPGLDLDQVVDDWIEVLEEGAQEEGVTLDEDWIVDLDLPGADDAVTLLYDGPEAAVSYYVLVAAVGDLVIEVNVQMRQDGWAEEIGEETLELFASFAFDPDALSAAYTGR